MSYMSAVTGYKWSPNSTSQNIQFENATYVSSAVGTVGAELHGNEASRVQSFSQTHEFENPLYGDSTKGEYKCHI